MNTLNVPICASEFGNTGIGECIKEIKKIVGAIQVPKSFALTAGDLATLQTVLVAKAHASVGARIFPYWNMVLTADNTEEPTIQTDEYGGKTATRMGDYDLTFRIKNTGVDVYGNIEKNAGPGKYFLFVDEDGTIIGKRSGDSLVGIYIDEFIVPPFRFAGGDTVTLYVLRFLFGSAQLSKGALGYINTDFPIKDEVSGLQDVTVSVVDQSDNVLKVVLKTKSGGINLYPAHSAQLAAAAAFFSRNQEDSSAITITSVATDATLDGGSGGFTVTLDSADYLAMDEGDKFSINLAAPAALLANPIGLEGYEGIAAVLEVPGS